jgi:wyosine [tRNA(Phe)-imidazoG37] synthetase (radical SAM superfamily)
MKYSCIYGPVNSWRLNRSLGIDPVAGKIKVCTFNCIYCQAGRAKPYSGRRKVFVPTDRIAKEIQSMPDLKIDYITFSGACEPTLAKNLGDIIKSIRKIRNEKIAVLTNSSLVNKRDVQQDLSLADLVAVKLDVPDKRLFQRINQPREGLNLDNIIKGIKAFKAHYKGRLAIQIMFMKDNLQYAKEIARIAKTIKPDEVYINTPLRPCSIKPLTKKEIEHVKSYFKGIRLISVYDRVKKSMTKPLDAQDTIRRRGGDI